jgi:hypothetical protein
MRPTVSEQLLGIRHVLGEVIAPQVTDSYATGILDGLMSALESLADGWHQVPRFLRWDAEQSAAVLTAAAAHLDAELVAELRSALADAPESDLDLIALQQHHRRLRALLEQAVPAIVGQPDTRALLVDHLRSRVGKYPITTRTPPPGAPTGGTHAHAAR